MTGSEMAREKEAVAAKMREKQAAGTPTSTPPYAKSVPNYIYS